MSDIFQPGDHILMEIPNIPIGSYNPFFNPYLCSGIDLVVEILCYHLVGLLIILRFSTELWVALTSVLWHDFIHHLSLSG